jgi:hypothetical protein
MIPWKLEHLPRYFHDCSVAIFFYRATRRPYSGKDSYVMEATASKTVDEDASSLDEAVWHKAMPS